MKILCIYLNDFVIVAVLVFHFFLLNTQQKVNNYTSSMTSSDVFHQLSPLCSQVVVCSLAPGILHALLRFILFFGGVEAVGHNYTAILNSGTKLAKIKK